MEEKRKMEKKVGILAAIAIVFMLLAAFVWATIPLNFSGVTLQSTFRAMDNEGKIQTLNAGLFSTVSYPAITKIQIGSTARVDLQGMASTDVQWWLDYQYKVTSKTSGKSGTYDAWEGGWSTDAGWAPYWKTWFAVQSGGSFDFENEKKAWWYSNHWEYRYGDGWMILDPNTADSVGDWIKWSGGLSETPAGDYDVTIDLHVKVNYKDNYGKEKTALGPPTRKEGSNGELFSFLSFTLNYAAGSASITITPKTSFTWIPLDVSGESSDYTDFFVTTMNSNGLPIWLLHTFTTIIAAAALLTTIYYYKKQ